MARINLQLRKEDSRHLVYSYSTLSGWIMFIAGLVGIAGLFLVESTDEPALLWFGGGVLVLVSLGGLYGALVRFELTFDLASRRYRGRRGNWPNVEDFSGSIDDLGEVLLETRFVRSSGKKSSTQERSEWRVIIDFDDLDQRATLLATFNEQKAYQRFEQTAKILRLDAVDRTDGQPIRRSWQDLDQSVADQLAASTSSATGLRAGGAQFTALGPPPHGSRVELDQSARGTVILLPADGFSFGTLAAMLFTGTFAALGIVSLLSLYQLIEFQIEVSSPLVGLVFTVLGVGLTMVVLGGSQLRERIEDGGDHLMTSSQLWGRQLGRTQLPKSAIEAVEIRSGTSRSRSGYLRVGRTTYGPRPEEGSEGQEVVIRTDGDIVRLGKALDPQTRAWVHGAITALAAN